MPQSAGGYLKVCEWKMTGVQNRTVENTLKIKTKKNERRNEKHCPEINQTRTPVSDRDHF